MKLTLALAASLALSLTLVPTASAECNNYGNEVNIGSVHLCTPGGTPREPSCVNYGVLVNVESTYKCGNAGCPNQGVMVNVASSYCGGHQTLQVCTGDNFCFPPPPLESQASSAAARPTPVDGSGCYANLMGNCTGGYCTFNAGVCWKGGYCYVNLLGVCTKYCLVNALAVCDRNCLVNAAGFCATDIIAVEVR